MTSRKNLLTGLGILLLVLLGSVSTAQAQYAAYPPSYYPPPPPPQPRGVYRSGLILGFAGGVGGLSANNCGDECGVAFMFEGHIGGMISPRAALMFEVWGADHPWTDVSGDSLETINTFWTAALQYWVTNQVWVKGGLGLGVIHIEDNDTLDETTATGFALFGAVGIELVQSYNFALDLQLRAGNGFYGENQGGDAQNYGLLLGVNWY
ncbi:MAG TPA: hypothetical protein VHG72_05030 [Polyangia bacterium]|nr:hypothetical protein [Polyangia bacterium]